jgi:hypothetical protein
MVKLVKLTRCSGRASAMAAAATHELPHAISRLPAAALRGSG